MYKGLFKKERVYGKNQSELYPREIAGLSPRYIGFVYRRHPITIFNGEPLGKKGTLMQVITSEQLLNFDGFAKKSLNRS